MTEHDAWILRGAAVPLLLMAIAMGAYARAGGHTVLGQTSFAGTFVLLAVVVVLWSVV